MGNDDLLTQLRERHAQAQAWSHYEGLGVARDADAVAVRKAHRALVRQFHPDRFARFDLGDEEALLSEVFNQISEAQKVLLDEEARLHYDAVLDGHIDPDVEGPNIEALFAAEQAMKNGQQQLERGDFKAAQANFELALSVNEGDANHEVHLAYASFMAGVVAKVSPDNPANKAHLATVQKHAREDKELVEAHFFLGKMLLLQDRSEEAERALKHVLRLCRGHVQASRELRALQMRQPQADAEGGFMGKLKKLFKR